MPTVIDLSNLGSAGFIIQGDSARDLAGRSVSSAGDVNGDGFDDVIVGALGGDDGGNSAGEAYVIFGKAGGFGTIDLSNLGAAGFIIQGDSGGDNAGYSVASAGDVNGDSLDDLIVGAPNGNDGGYDAGEAYVVFGKASGFGTVDLSNLGAAGFIIQGDATYDNAGWSVASAGDVNGDGFDDVIIGSKWGNDGDPLFTGEAYVIFGKASGFGTIDLTNLGADGFIIEGAAAYDHAGWSVSSAGDVNGDGFDDVIVGAPYSDIGGANAGAAYVVFGKANGFGTIDLANLGAAGFLIQGGANTDVAGRSVSSAGDVNGDGFGDLIVGSPLSSGGGNTAGEAYVIFGKAGGFGTIDLSNLGAGGFIIQGGVIGANVGFSVSSAGDVNGDGFDDQIVGAPFHGGVNAGEAYVVFGKAGGFGTVDLTNLASAHGFIITGAINDQAGTSVASAGDFNGDGFDDVIVGAPGGDYGGPLTGEAYVIFGMTSGDQHLFGTPGDDVLKGGFGNDFIDGGDGDDELFGQLGNDELAGGGGNDTLDGGQGNDFLDGGAGIDTMAGGFHNDVYVVDNAGDVVTELAGGGTDSVSTLVDYQLGAGSDVERLTSISWALTTPLKLTGNEFVNLIEGNAGNNTLDGRGGADRLVGFGGNDKYVVDTAGDVVVEASGGGTDSISALVDYTLALDSHVERLNAISAALTTPLKLTGNNFVNQIEGNAGNNILDGRGGADALIGFGGNDKYVVDNAGDVVTELAGGGTDSISAAVDYTLGVSSHVERLNAISFALTTPLKLTGNNFVNQIEGNAGNNILDGRGGADALIGFGGNDKYVVDNAGDVVTELAGGGTDSISAAVDYTLGVSSHVERLNAISFALTTPLKLTGNNFVNLIEGNAGNNTLDGRGGADTLVGLGGDDKYVIDNAGDVVTEGAGGGNDSVSTVVDYQLTASSHVERLTSISWALTTPLKLTGNELANRVEGNAGNNILDGKGGADTLVAFGGADTFAFTSALGGGNVDTIEGFVSGTDKIALDDAVFAGLAPGALPAGAFVTGTAAQDAGDRIVYNSTTGALSFDADGNGAGMGIQFATLLGAPALTASDLIVI